MCTQKKYEAEREIQHLLRKKLNRIFHAKTEQLQLTLNEFKKNQL